MESEDGATRRCAIIVSPSIPAAIAFRVDYRTSVVQVWLTNVDRFDRVGVELRSSAIDEPLLEDLIRFVLGRDNAFLRHAPLIGIHGSPR